MNTDRWVNFLGWIEVFEMWQFRLSTRSDVPHQKERPFEFHCHALLLIPLFVPPVNVQNLKSWKQEKSNLFKRWVGNDGHQQAQTVTFSLSTLFLSLKYILLVWWSGRRIPCMEEPGIGGRDEKQNKRRGGGGTCVLWEWIPLYSNRTARIWGIVWGSQWS